MYPESYRADRRWYAGMTSYWDAALGARGETKNATPFSLPFHLVVRDHLPRQARDKHTRKGWKTVAFVGFSAGNITDVIKARGMWCGKRNAFSLPSILRQTAIFAKTGSGQPSSEGNLIMETAFSAGTTRSSCSRPTMAAPPTGRARRCSMSTRPSSPARKGATHTVEERIIGRSRAARSRCGRAALVARHS